MSKKDLSDVCNYLKGIVIAQTPEDYTAAEPFMHGLSNAELRAGISAFRSLLYDLYDRLAAQKDRFDTATGKKYDPDSGEESIYKCFPVVNDLAVILFSLGIHGRLETQPTKALVVDGEKLLKPLDKEKFQAIAKMKDKRTLELFGLLSDIGLRFEGADFSAEVDFSKTGAFRVTREGDEWLPVGLKLIAEAQANIKSDYFKFTTALMRCDFYPLANTAPKPHTVNINEFVGSLPPEVRGWVADMDKLLTDGSCKVVGEIQNFTGSGAFTYTSRKSKKVICKIHIGISGCGVSPNANHLEKPNNIVAELTDDMLDNMKSGPGCGSCAKKDPTFVHCRHGGPFKFKHNGQHFDRCRFYGFGFPMDSVQERDLLMKWIELELACS